MPDDLKDIKATLTTIMRLLEKISTTQERHTEQIAEVKGQLSMLALWQP